MYAFPCIENWKLSAQGIGLIKMSIYRFIVFIKPFVFQAQATAGSLKYINSYMW